MNAIVYILFYIKRTKANKEGHSPIYVRVTIQSRRFEFSSNKFIHPDKWNTEAAKVRGNNEEARTINSHLDRIRSDIHKAEHTLFKKGTPIDIHTLRNELFPDAGTARMLVSIFQDHNNKIQSLIGQEYAPGTLERYKTSLKHTIDFLISKHKTNDIDIRKIDHAFIMDYEFYLRNTRKCNNNTAVKYIKNFRKIINICLANGWLDRDPFVNYKSKIREVERNYLTQEEVQTIYRKTFATDRLNTVKDIFIFSCFTGLAYIDVRNLTPFHINIGIDGGKWIFTHRQKTETPSRIPLLPLVLEIIERYKDHPQCNNEGTLLPILSNQKMNAYLKEIADICGIRKELTFHIARHTFATTITLSNGVPIESVSKMLGHKNLRTTQHYAKILDQKISNDMQALKEKFEQITFDNKTKSR
ncbi:site-specific integrase [Elizabethkingia meningoseptica]|uniref:site-specific integrase n=1 Tax=Elizabethkingia meningoseptica TaxID=238 RepID=UPI002011C622|nr:site-specific integrase [Elizabethkingia meningoseptica]MCL1674309.1 site-specific integrase [Elizabethkingia meningoseptica]MCL1686070.1 site-specific integrase [Elizabethkingia meningoseptica]